MDMATCEICYDQIDYNLPRINVFFFVCKLIRQQTYQLCSAKRNGCFVNLVRIV